MTTKERIQSTNKDIRLTVGFKFRNPTTYEKLVSKQEAIKTIEWAALSEIDNETEDEIYLHCYSENDMW